MIDWSRMPEEMANAGEIDSMSGKIFKLKVHIVN